jgi:20S proteasome alpha/beta subunit
VTIALAIQCRDGAVLCADSQITKEGGLKYNDQKIFEMFPGEHDRVALCYAGSPEIMRLVVERLEKDLPESLDADTFREILEVALRDIYKKQGTKRQVELLCSVYADRQGTALFRAIGSLVRPAEKAECLGVGDSSVLRFIADVFLRYDITIRQGLTLGCYMVAKARTYIDGCGGPTQALFLNHKGKMRSLNDIFVDGLSPDDGLPEVENAVRDLCYGIALGLEPQDVLKTLQATMWRTFDSPINWLSTLEEKGSDYFSGPEAKDDD